MRARLTEMRFTLDRVRSGQFFRRDARKRPVLHAGRFFLIGCVMRISSRTSDFGRRHLRWLSLAVVFGLLAVAMPTQAAAATNQMDFSPASATVAAGGTVNVDITISNVTNLGGYDLYLQFDPAVVHLTSLVDAGFVTNNPTNVVVCNNPATIDNTAGTATDSCDTAAFPPPGPGVSTTTPVALMHASFTGVSSGTSSLTLNGTDLLDPSGIQLAPAPTLGTGSITVSGSVGGVAMMPDVGALHSARASTSGAGQVRLFVLAAIAIAAVITLAVAIAWRRMPER
jgi:hypothetical protein